MGSPGLVQYIGTLEILLVVSSKIPAPTNNIEVAMIMLVQLNDEIYLAMKVKGPY